MEAVILAGGLGSRLRPLTDRHPKHVLPVAGLPFLAHQLARLAAAGVDHVVLAVSYRADEVAAVFGDGSGYGVRLTYVLEPEPLGTGGAIRAASDHLNGRADDPVIVLNGDQLSDHDLAEQVVAFGVSGADVSLQLAVVADPRAYGCVPTDADGRVTGFQEKSPDPVSHQVNAGCYVFRRAVIDTVPPGAVVSVERETFPRLLRDGRILVGHRTDGYWTDVGTPGALVLTSSDLVRGLVRSPALPTPSGERLVHPAAEMHPGARVVGGSVLGEGCVVGDGAVVDGSILMAGAVVAPASTVRQSALGPGSAVGPECVVRASVLGDGARLGGRCELREGARIGCDVRIPDGAVRFGAG
ncbi:MAG: NDP-sugar synthase [Actinomycetota bacterium]|nr:NDP-sugar synthase [Actinomycetota bacterium]